MPNGQGIGFAATIIYNLMGFELVANLGNQMRNPAKDMAKAILFSAAMISLLYILGSFAELVAIPVGHLNLVSGLIDTLITMLGKGWFATLVGLLYCVTSLGNQVTWFMAPSMAMAVAAQDGAFPKQLGKFHPKHQTPYIANFVAMTVSSVVAVLYAVLAAGNRTDLFWSLFSFSSALILVCYIVYFAAFLKLRITDATTPRPFKVPGSMPGAVIAAILCIISALFALMLFFFPTIFSGVINWQQSLPVIGGVLISIIVGELLIRAGERQGRRSSDAADAGGQSN
jgi:amino acid transporter